MIERDCICTIRLEIVDMVWCCVRIRRVPVLLGTWPVGGPRLGLLCWGWMVRGVQFGVNAIRSVIPGSAV